MNAQKEKNKIYKALSHLEGLNTARRQIMALVDDDIKAIDSKRKEARQALQTALKACGDHVAAVAVCNILAPTEQGADDARRQQIRRRRKVLCIDLAAAYPDYSFAFDKAAGKIIPTFIGSPERQEATALLAAVARLKSVGGKVSDKVDDLTAKIKAAASVTSANTSTKKPAPKPADVSDSFRLCGIEPKRVQAMLNAKAQTVAAKPAAAKPAAAKPAAAKPAAKAVKE